MRPYWPVYSVLFSSVLCTWCSGITLHCIQVGAVVCSKVLFCRPWLWPAVIWVPVAFMWFLTSLPILTSDPWHQHDILLPISGAPWIVSPFEEEEEAFIIASFGKILINFLLHLPNNSGCNDTMTDQDNCDMVKECAALFVQGHYRKKQISPFWLHIGTAVFLILCPWPIKMNHITRIRSQVTGCLTPTQLSVDSWTLP